MTQPVPPPIANPTTPSWRPPAGATDCHIHIWGPESDYPYSPDRGYTPPDASVADYLHMLNTIGFERCVIVHPSVYGTDNRRSLDAAREFGAIARGVAVVDDSASESELRELHDSGFCGTRFNLVSKGALDTRILENVAARVGEMGWHIQVFATGKMLVDVAPLLRKFKNDIVLDHIGGMDGTADLTQPGFQVMMDLLAEGRTWVKLSGAYRVDHGPAPWPQARPFAEALIDAAPDRLLWGTDWPHPGPAGAMPDDGDLVNALGEWTTDETLRRKILVDNPAKLYGFD